MAIYLKKFETTSQYNAYTADTANFIKPNVSFIEETNGVAYNPYVIPPTPSHDYVDLGLPSGTKWATMNIGAEHEYENGSYFSWGNIEAHEKGSGYDFSQTTYNTTSGSTLSGDISADSGYDMARENWGGSWRLPTKAEFRELYDNCTWTWETSNGINGYRVTSNVEGYTSNSIFIPAAGFYGDTELYAEGSYGNYWSSNLFAGEDYVYFLRFKEDDVDPQNEGGSRSDGYSVRAVQS